MNEIAEMLAAAAVVPDRREVWEWAGGTAPDRSDAAVDFGSTTSFKGKYDVDNVPWMKEFLRRVNSPEVREITFIGPPQDSGKTKAAELYLSKRIAKDPTNAAFNTTTNVKAEAWAETRWEAMLSSVKGIKEKFSDNVNKKKVRRIIFADSTFLIIQGAETEGNRQSDSVEVQINDEVYLWERGWLAEMHERCNAYRETCKKINISIGGTKGSELEERFLAGNQMELHHECPICSKPFSYVFDHKDPKGNIRFDINKAILHADGELDLREFEKTIHVDCQSCGHQMAWDKDRLRAMNLAASKAPDGGYIAKNPRAPASIVSMRVNAFAIGREPWVDILRPWVKMHIRGGVFSPEVLKSFIVRKLCEFWDERPYVVTTEIKLAGWARADVIKPKSWPDELFRFMTCDNQRGRQGDIPHRWFGGFAISATGTLRMIDGGRINEWVDLKKKQIELGIPDPTEIAPGPWVLVDRRWDPVDVDEWCAKFKWYGTMGAVQDEFLHPPWSPYAETRQLFTEPRYIDIGFGTSETGRTHATYYLWASQRVQDLVAKLRNAGKIEFPRDVTEWCAELGLHMNSHKQFMEAQRDGGEKRMWKKIGDTPDHLYDIVCQAVVVGCMAGVYKPEPEEKK